MNAMWKALVAGLCVALIGLSALSAGPALAGEKGKWRGLSVLGTTKFESAKVADHEGHEMMFSIQDGAVFNASGGGFLDRARYQVVWMSDTSRANGGYKTFTAADGSQVFAYTNVTSAAAPDWKGTWEFTGGTGKYKGIRGKGTFHVHDLSDTAAWDILEGEYEIP